MSTGLTAEMLRALKAKIDALRPPRAPAPQWSVAVMDDEGLEMFRAGGLTRLDPSTGRYTVMIDGWPVPVMLVGPRPDDVKVILVPRYD